MLGGSRILSLLKKNERHKEPSYLPLTENQARLLCLRPGNKSEPIVFELETFSLEQENLPFYEAVSYTWGDPSATATVECSGRHIIVTKSVVALLRRFRLRNSTRKLWVDAVCIDQRNCDEKSIQVGLMDVIYQRASRVLIYIGEADETYDGTHTDEIMMHFSNRSSASSLMATVGFLESRPWFHRIWVLQELALADCALVICGPHCIPWSCITTWWTINEKSYQRSWVPPPTLSVDFSVKRPSLLQQLHDTRLSRATDPRDKIYGLTGLLSPEDKKGIIVDYRETVSAVYQKAATFIVEHGRSLKLLSAVRNYVSKQTDYNYIELSSWVPDWRQDPEITSLGLSNVFLEPYDAGGSVACGLHVSNTDDGCNELKVLHCLGIGLDVIETLGQTCPMKASKIEDEIINTLNHWYNLYSPKWQRARRSVINYHDPLAIFTLVSSMVEPERETFWDTIHAKPSPTLDLTRQEYSRQTKGYSNHHQTAQCDSMRFCLGRRFLITKGGFIGLAPPEANIGDTVAVLIGAPTPHVLRPQSSGDYKLVGECYVNGIMGGEAIGHLTEELEAKGHRCRPYPKSKSTAPLRCFTIR